MPEGFRPGEMVWADIAFRREGRVEVKRRPALVLEPVVEGVRVAWGTRTERDRPHVCVRAAERAGIAWQLTSDTWFYGDTQTVAPEGLRKIVPPPTGRLADPRVAVEICALAT